ncbi:hypothetical protein R5R35_001658 [Gryllus longicercus]|uniref:Uncharacterized protein n=1 Tax=Gryllus longicercus TaxID=2509291 RepID=A0AAN9VMW7_9ORTH
MRAPSTRDPFTSLRPLQESMFSFIDDILNKYAGEELDFELNLRALRARRQQLHQQRRRRSPQSPPARGAAPAPPSAATTDPADSATPIAERRLRAQRRNSAWIKELEISAAKLHARSRYCPPEEPLIELQRRYLHDLLHVQGMVVGRQGRGQYL